MMHPSSSQPTNASRRQCRTRWKSCVQMLAPGRPAVAVLLAASLMLGLVATEAWGCPTCKDGVIAADDASANIARGYFYSILLMLAMPFTLASCFGMYVWREYRRQHRAGVFDHITDPSGRHAPQSMPVGESAAPAADRSPRVAAGSHAS